MSTYPRDVPRVSVIIPAHNAARYVSEALDSVAAQTYPNLELIVVNDGSDDETGAILEQYRDRPMRLIEQPQAGVSAARNAGIEASSGELLAFLDADDVWHPRKVERQVRCLSSSPTVGGATTGVCLIGPQGQHRGLARVDPEGSLVTLRFPDVLDLFCFVTSSLMVPRDVLEHIGPFDEALETAEDLDLIARVSAHYPIKEIREPLLQYRVSEDSLSKRVFTGNRLRVLDKIAKLPEANTASIRTALRRARAKVQLSYGDDLLWHGRPAAARARLLGSLGHQPSLPAVALLIKTLLPASFRRLLRLLASYNPAAAPGPEPPATLCCRDQGFSQREAV